MAATDALQRKRLRFLLSTFAVVIGFLVVFRLGYWMIIKSEWLKEKASVQWVRELPIEPQRGNIEDRNGNILAASVTSNTVVLHPKLIKEEELDDLVSALNAILGIDEDIIREKASKTNYSVVWLKRQISQEQSQKIKELDSGGVSLAEDKKRYYPLGNFLTQVLGFTSVDGEGLEGIESRFDQILHGIPGSIVTFTDRDGQPLPGYTEEYTDPVEGNNLRLTIDMAIQSYTENAMELCLKETGAESVTAIVINSDTGEILALVNKPDFDNNEPPRNDLEMLRELTKNTAISYSYEPGSIFGLFSVAAGLDSKTVDTSYNYYCDGDLEVGEEKVVCWSEGGNGDANLFEAVSEICNLTFSDIALRTGLNTFYDYIDRLGFGKKSEVKLYGESEGEVISPKYITEEELARIGYGQGIEVTSMQMAAAFSTLVNGGHYVKPYIVKSVVGTEGEILESYSSEITHSVISYETSDKIRDIMSYSSQYGNGVAINVEGYEIGAVTGTAQKYDSEGTIIEGKHIATLAAAAPIDNPKIVIYIAVDDPENGADYGAVCAAPYAQMILEEALPYLSIMPVTQGSQGTVQMPDIIEMDSDDAQQKLKILGLNPIILGYDGKVAAQYPEVGEYAKPGSTVLIMLEQEDDQNEAMKVEVPDVIEVGALEASLILAERGLKVKIIDRGSVVTAQYPEPGEEAYSGDTIYLTFEYIDEEVTQEE